MKKSTKNSTGSFYVSMMWLTLMFLALWWVKNPQIASFLMEHPERIMPYIIEQVGWLKLFLGISLSGVILVLIIVKPGQNSRHRKLQNQNVLRGAEILPTRRLISILKKAPKPEFVPQLEIAAIPIPQQLENRGFFMFGSPGTGKTQAISQMTALIRQRPDFRAFIFDRNGEMLERFYDPARDLIFNPFDARSVSWCHAYEAARPETMAASLVPEASEQDPFFSQAARVILAELFRKTTSNEELWSLLISNTKTLHSFTSGTLAARYLEEDKVATSVLSTLSNYCQFYPYLNQLNNKTISFFDWARQGNRRWVFITLRENESELLKPLHSLIFELMLKGLLSNEHRKMKTAIIIDELGALNELKSLSRLMSESRKFLGCPILGTQTEAQISKIYGRDDTIAILQGTATKLILKCADPQTATTMAKIIGKQEYTYQAENQSRSRHLGKRDRSETFSFNEQFRESYAVMPEEIGNLKDLHGYLKIAQYCAPVRIRPTSFSAQAERFVPIAKSIEEQWSGFEE